MERPAPAVLFSQSFQHSRPGEHVDEVRFSEPVVITACEILDQQAASLCSSLSLAGLSSPQSFSVEIFVRSGGDARFKRFCQPFLYSSSAAPLPDAQAFVTDHVVLRGTYDSLTLVLYGNLASSTGQIGGDRHLYLPQVDGIPVEASFKVEDLPEALRPQSGIAGCPFSSLRCLRLINTGKETIDAIRGVLELVGETQQAAFHPAFLQKIVTALSSAAASLRASEKGHQSSSFFDSWPTSAEPNSVEFSELPSKRLHLLVDAKNELEDLRSLLLKTEANNSGEDGTVDQMEGVNSNGSQTESKRSLDVVLELILNWIQGAIQSSGSSVLEVYLVEGLIAGLAAAQLLCTDAQECYRFVLAGGARLLMDVPKHMVGNLSATTLLAVGAMECVSRYAFGCEALLGWWNPGATESIEDDSLLKESSGNGYAILLKLLLHQRPQPVTQIAARVLHRLRGYELASRIESAVEDFISKPTSLLQGAHEVKDEAQAVTKVALLIKQLLVLLKIGEVSRKEGASTRFLHWLALDSQGPHADCATAARGLVLAEEDMEPFLLSILQERRFLLLLVTFLSSPKLRSLNGPAVSSCAELVGVIEALLLALMGCRAGTLFLAEDSEVATALLVTLQSVEDVYDRDHCPLRHATALTSTDNLCHPQDLGSVFRTHLSVIGAMDRLCNASGQSEESMWALWDLSTTSRHESGRQSLLMLTWFPEVLNFLTDIISADLKSTALVAGTTWQRAAVHFAAEVLQVILNDAAASTIATWTPLAPTLQRALMVSTSVKDGFVAGDASVVENKDGICFRLLEWLDPAVVYHKKGAVGLLKYVCATLASGAGIAQTGSGIPVGDTMDVDANEGDETGNSEIRNVALPYTGKGNGIKSSAHALSDAATMKITIACRVLALVSRYPGVAAVLYGEGAMAVLHGVLDQTSSALFLTSNAYDAAIDEDMEYDGTAEDLGDHAKEQLFLGLLLPALSFLLALLQNLQAAVGNYQNTRLVDTLLTLHLQMSSRIASYSCAPPYSWSGITQDFIAVRQVLTSVLACWPIFGWTPSLFPRLLGIDNSGNATNVTLLPVEPSKMCSILTCMTEMLPVECPRLCNGKDSLSDFYKTFAVENILGRQAAVAVSWHTQSPHSEQLVQALALNLDEIVEVIGHHAATGCEILQDVIKLFIIRLACVNGDHAAALVRPLLNQIRNQGSTSTDVFDKETMHVEYVIQLLESICLHPASKAILLREGAVAAFLNADLIQTQIASGDAGPLAGGKWPWTLKACTALCDPEISLSPSSSLSRRLVEDCPRFGDYCSIVLWLLKRLQVAAIDQEFEAALKGFTELAGNKLGRAAVAFVSFGRQTKTKPTAVEETSVDSGNFKPPSGEIIGEQDSEILEELTSPVFLELWQRLRTALESRTVSGILITEIIRQFAIGALVLSAAGKSTCGVAALSCLFGLDLEPSEDASSKYEKLTPVIWIESTMRECMVRNDDGEPPTMDISFLSSVPTVAIKEAQMAVSTMLRILQRSEVGKAITGKARLVVEAQSTIFSAGSISPRRTKRQTYNFAARALALYAKQHSPLWDKNSGSLKGVLPQKDWEALALDPKGRLAWECSAVVPDRNLPRITSKKRSMSTPDGGRKRHGLESAAGPGKTMEGLPGTSNGATPGQGRNTPASGTPSSMQNRRDTFRQRKPNTSRPPSMHVDDYVARERSEVTSSGINPAVPIQRSTSGSGRPPSIHVDEFMAKQQERQNAASVSSSGKDDHHANVSMRDMGKRGVTSEATPSEAVKVLVEDNQMSAAITPEMKPEQQQQQQWEDMSVAENFVATPGLSSSDFLDHPHPESAAAASAPSLTPDTRSERTSSSSSSRSTATDSVHSVKTPQGTDMLIQQSTFTRKVAMVTRIPGGSVQGEEPSNVVKQTVEESFHVRDSSRELAEARGAQPSSQKRDELPISPWASEVPPNSTITAREPDSAPLPLKELQHLSGPRASKVRHDLFGPSPSQHSPGWGNDPPAAKHVASFGKEIVGTPPMHSEPLNRTDFPLRDSSMHAPAAPDQPQAVVRDPREVPPFPSRSGRFPDESQPSASSQSSPAVQDPRLGTRQVNSANRADRHKVGQEVGIGPLPKSIAVPSHATDPRPRPRPHEEQAERHVANPIPPSPASPWVQGSQTKENLGFPPPPTSLPPAARGGPPYASPPAPGPQLQSGDGSKGPPNSIESPWPAHVPVGRGDETSIPYGLQGAPAQSPGSSFVPAGAQGTRQRLMSSPPPPPPLPPPPPPPSAPPPSSLKGGVVPFEGMPGQLLAGSDNSSQDSRFSPHLQNYGNLASLQPMPYLQPPVPAGRPSTPHASPVPINIQTQQQLQMHLQQQNIIKQQLQQQQQLSGRQYPVAQHPQSQQQLQTQQLRQAQQLQQQQQQAQQIHAQQLHQAQQAQSQQLHQGQQQLQSPQMPNIHSQQLQQQSPQLHPQQLPQSSHLQSQHLQQGRQNQPQQVPLVQHSQSPQPQLIQPQHLPQLQQAQHVQHQQLPQAQQLQSPQSQQLQHIQSQQIQQQQAQHLQSQQLQQRRLQQQQLLGRLSVPGQASPQPPLPPTPLPPTVVGKASTPSLPPASAVSHPSIPSPATTSQAQQQESSAVLQQMLASPGAIQALLKDQSQLQALLEKHPKLITLLQERMSQGHS